MHEFSIRIGDHHSSVTGALGYELPNGITVLHIKNPALAPDQLKAFLTYADMLDFVRTHAENLIIRDKPNFPMPTLVAMTARQQEIIDAAIAAVKDAPTVANELERNAVALTAMQAYKNDETHNITGLTDLQSSLFLTTFVAAHIQEQQRQAAKAMHQIREEYSNSIVAAATLAAKAAPNSIDAITRYYTALDAAMKFETDNWHRHPVPFTSAEYGLFTSAFVATQIVDLINYHAERALKAANTNYADARAFLSRQIYFIEAPRQDGEDSDASVRLEYRVVNLIQRINDFLESH